VTGRLDKPFQNFREVTGGTGEELLDSGTYNSEFAIGFCRFGDFPVCPDLDFDIRGN
jgi:hypothetical protein